MKVQEFPFRLEREVKVAASPNTVFYSIGLADGMPTLVGRVYETNSEEDLEIYRFLLIPDGEQLEIGFNKYIGSLWGAENNYHMFQEGS